MASPNAPKSSEQLIREHSQARYVTYNPRTYGYDEASMASRTAVDQQARKYR